ncbi:MAG TPA: thioesterase family protein [Usitatibacteraceae bacterium]|nr:thioesterase family protein [Usitatibacteraceae bacterium]
MPLKLDIPAGLRGEVTLTVDPSHTAAQVGSGKIRVLATPVLINLFEAAALKACEHLLPEGHQSLGTRLDISHVAATPVGMKVIARAEVTGVEGRTVQFRLEAHDERDLIGEGRHERVVVSVARFDERVREKVAAVAAVANATGGTQCKAS